MYILSGKMPQIPVTNMYYIKSRSDSEVLAQLMGKVHYCVPNKLNAGPVANIRLPCPVVSHLNDVIWLLGYLVTIQLEEFV